MSYLNFWLRYLTDWKGLAYVENQPIFKTSLFGGFERQSVLNYIFELNNNAQAAQDRLSAQFEEVSAARERLSESIRGLEQKLSTAEKVRTELEEELSEEKTKRTEMNDMLDSLNAEIDRQKIIIAEKDAEINRFGEIRARLEEKNAELEAGRSEVEKASIYLGDLVVKTKLEAEQILEDANQQAQGMMEEATKSLATVFEQFGKFREEMEAIEEKIEDAIFSIQEKFSAIGNTIVQSEENIRDFYRPFNLTLVQDEAGENSELSDISFFRSTAD